MNWEWLVRHGLIEGDPNYYASGQATSAEYAHAIETAYRAADDVERKELVNMLWSTGKFAGDPSYWYTYRGNEIGDLGRAASSLSADDTSAFNDPANRTGETPTSAEAEARENDEAAEAAAAATSGEETGTGETTPGEPAPGVTPPATNAPAGDTGLSRSDLQAIYYWMPAGALAVFIDAYIDKGKDAAYAAIRQHPDYEVWFPGNMDDNGNIRYAEDQYAGVRESYRDVMRSVGLEPGAIAALEAKFVDLMEGEVSPPEFQARVDGVYNRIISASEQIKQYYADYHGIGGLETVDLLFAALDPEFGRLTFEEDFRIAEVGGAAAESGFGIDATMAELISDKGVNLAAARDLFGSAQHLVPILDMLAQRHYDPDDDFDITEFVSSEVFNDPAQNLRMRRLLARERSTFGRTGSFAKEGEAISGLTVA